VKSCTTNQHRGVEGKRGGVTNQHPWGQSRKETTKGKRKEKMKGEKFKKTSK
jgi:hypothetical protein